MPTSHWYTPTKYQDQVPSLYDRIRQWLPPNEFNPTQVAPPAIAELPAILNAAWQAYVNGREPMFAWIDPAVGGHQRFDGLILKGIEAAEQQLAFRDRVPSNGNA